MATVHPYGDDAPVMHLIGYGFRPAYQPADYIGPRLDCPMWLPTADADVAYLAKWEAPAAGYAWGDVLWPTAPADAAPQITAASLAGPIPGPLIPGFTPGGNPFFPPIIDCCDGTTPPGTVVVVPPVNPVPQPAPVSVEAGAGAFLLAAIGLLFARKVWAAMGRFGDWFTAERGTAPHQNGWV
ncbi:hypothetical protein [Paracoccus sp. 22332]|uniref:hypothetical protein n=1 Tax=Paracoccus sp. 22332 TaxID=3453913 RepID=UPI003F877291